MTSLLVLGGARSGKSHYAQAAAEALPGDLVYVATAQAFDAEMAERIARHRSDRGRRWRTVEEPLDLPATIDRISRPGTVVLVDCLTLWLTNVMLAGHDPDAAGERLAGAIAGATGPLIVVANEVGLGIVPDNALARRFLDAAGRLNQIVAQAADEVVFIAAGLPLRLKQEPIVTDVAPIFDARFVQQLDQLLHWRRDVRHFLPRPVAEADLAQLFAAAALAPSVGNAQPWRFVRVRSANLRARLADHVDRCVAEAAPKTRRQTLYGSLKLHGIREAPELLAVFCDDDPGAGHDLGIATMREALTYSTVMAIHNLWLAARVRGIGLGWVSILDPGEVSAMLDVPASWSLVALLCVGYPAEPSAVPELEARGWQDREPMADRLFER